jgi:hypothetical protein
MKGSLYRDVTAASSRTRNGRRLSILFRRTPIRSGKMVSGISSAVGAVNAAYARYDRSASAVVAAGSDDNGSTGDLAGTMVEMDQSKIQFTASLLMMRKSNDALANMLDLFYGAPVEG